MTDSLGVDKQTSRMQVEADRLPVNLDEAVEGMSEALVRDAITDILQCIPHWKYFCQSDIRTQRDLLAHLFGGYVGGDETPKEVLRQLFETFEHTSTVRWWKKELLYT